MMEISIKKTAHPGKLPPADQLGFGSVFTDHMFLMDYTDQAGWHNARIVPFGPVSISPAASVLHYGTEVFEGLKAYGWKGSAVPAVGECCKTEPLLRPAGTAAYQ